MPDNTKKIIVNAIGSAGYIFLLIEWFWIAIIVAYPLFSSDFSFFMPPLAPTPTPQLSLGALQPIATFVAIATSILVLIMAVITIVQLPASVAKKGKKASSQLAKQIVPHVIPKKEQTKKRVVELSTRLTYTLKFAAIIIPLFVLILAPNTTSLTKEITIIVASFFCLIATATFALQAGLAVALRLPQKYLW